MIERKASPSDLRDAAWQESQGLVPAPLPGGRPAKDERREIVNAVWYVLRRGCAWRRRPQALPPKETASAYVERWREDGPWEKIAAARRGERVVG